MGYGPILREASRLGDSGHCSIARAAVFRRSSCSPPFARAARPPPAALLQRLCSSPARPRAPPARRGPVPSRPGSSPTPRVRLLELAARDGQPGRERFYGRVRSAKVQTRPRSRWRWPARPLQRRLWPGLSRQTDGTSCRCASSTRQLAQPDHAERVHRGTEGVLSCEALRTRRRGRWSRPSCLRAAGLDPRRECGAPRPTAGSEPGR